MLKKVLLVSLVASAAGLLAAGCVVSSDDVCDGISCDGFGLCLDVGGLPECSCDDGYMNDGALHCVPEGWAVDFDWAFGPGARTCSEAYVTDVRVQLFDGADEILNELVDCQDGGAIIEPVDNGLYTLDLTGLSADGDEWYYTTVDVDVLDGDEDLGLVTLDPTGTGDMSFEWAFGVDEWDCLTAGVSRVRVEVYDMSGNLEFEANPVPDCADLGAVLTDFELGTWNLVLEGVCDADLQPGYLLDVNVDVAHPGVNDYGLVVLDEEAGGCP